MDINKCNIYFGNLKIKTGYFGQYKFYEDDARKELTLLKFDDAIYNGVYVAPKYSIIYEDSLTLLKFSEV